MAKSRAKSRAKARANATSKAKALLRLKLINYKAKANTTSEANTWARIASRERLCKHLIIHHPTPDTDLE